MLKFIFLHEYISLLIELLCFNGWGLEVVVGFQSFLLGVLRSISIEGDRNINGFLKFAGKDHFAASGRQCLPSKVECHVSTVFVRGEVLDNDVVYPGKVFNLNLRN